ncbi:MAG: universal stress protein [Planctomycetes bacterium]|nr:universal stress protein [Planctomycetota bacterium]
MAELCVATDLSPASTPAIDLAMRWARALPATVVLLHVVHDPVLAPALGNDVPGDIAAAKVRLQQLAGAAPDVTCRIVVRAADDVVGTIVAAAAGSHYLFVGTHGRSGFQRLRLGSVAAAVLRQSHVPVVCVPAGRG